MSQTSVKAWPKLPCKWAYDDDDGTWATACGELFAFTEEGPVENKFHFCCYCGGELVPCKRGACSVCEGRGWDADDNTCGACDGSGRTDEHLPLVSADHGVQPSTGGLQE